MDAVNILSFSTVIFLFDVIVGVVLSECISKVSEAFNKLTDNGYLLEMEI